MAVNFTSLADCIKNNDPEGFLKSYMMLVIAGKELSIPKSKNYTEVKRAWFDILYGVPGGFSEEFLIDISNIWLQIQRHIQGGSDQVLAKQMVDFLKNNQINRAVKQSQTAQQAPAKSVTSEFVEKETPQKPKLKVKVPEQYKVKQVAPVKKNDIERVKGRPPVQRLDADTVKKTVEQATQNLEKATLNTGMTGGAHRTEYDNVDVTNIAFDEDRYKAPDVLNRFIEDGEVGEFIVGYLAQAQYKINPKIPLSSVLDIIKVKWREILLEEFDHIPEDSFLNNLSQRWFRLMTTYGLPSSKERIRALLKLILENQKEMLGESNKPEKPEKKKKGRFKWF